MALDTAKAVVTLRSLTAKFDKAAKAAQPFYPRVCTIAPSDGADEEYGMLGDMPQMREWIGDRQSKELRAGKYTLVNRHWEQTLGIKKTDLADDRMGMYAMLMPQLGTRGATHPDKLLFESMVAGETTACFDGQFFYDTDHAWGDSGTQNNDLTYNATDHTAVTVAEFKAAFNAAVSAMISFKDDQNEPLNQPVVNRFSDLQLIVPRQLRQVAHEAMESTVLSDSSNIVVDRPEIVTSAYLTTGTKFYLNNLADPLKPFVFQARQPLERQMKGLDDLETKDVLFMTEARYAIGYLAWWASVLTTFN